MSDVSLAPIGVIHSAFDEKFGTPRQPGLVPAAEAELILHPPYDAPEALRGLAQYSHVHLLFWFHRSAEQGWSPTVRPPRLGGNERLGVFATRSPFRPNPVGLSVVELAGLIDEPGRRGLRLRGHDLVDGTPVLDIKPYVPYADAHPQARAPAAFSGPPPRLSVGFAESARAALAGLPPATVALIEQTLALDPRPAYRRGDEGREYGVSLAGYNLRFRVAADRVTVLSLGPLAAPPGAGRP
ncbi:tRNA (N6-threonylcarbamoyladenosine(37)-N6)-methyltransferase TrmO [Alkalilimnicola sp. S0819]|uniref:tRNA (N6-threonylcarbamoyladenosine(37)-N6)-methyltransferase TrmO n=1 Tax=Alkalilimnicola sp. S0819 TaxID=2613922 RepID=UPI001261EC1B|nr:tRNA (N6-threonylcarbamoyladenosine(37)-N6)-methyltransferase TrmO [Alkalilimnicola sp. S0819]KAB7624066.1 tRNA (N6-threonylcarbamoyladenosine(37)-N6)-methyltransferase TrmO [Alkalilimnicola sp. S0819]MPQ16316.1 tRNA (N6-threonylcarbamoyladenosine(37)-N6)-methyltransferase TrmO [Alkalilimnicola sp. S0819]